MCLCVSPYTMAIRRAFHFCQQNTGPLKPYQFPLIAVRPPANHMNNTRLRRRCPTMPINQSIQLKGQVAIQLLLSVSCAFI